ncbi:uncharacterized protein LOC115374608 [Myripristis murdjan]|uniref:uncharacterized protein LOC115374608 n=1 Tax=Myripristis murdjan TaxID=586833 RepID=UPI0011760841|nr:uncharacterized protein LOC115374608 [Myripristis murdjan]
MAGEDGGKCRSHQAAAVVLLMCTLVPCLPCFSLRLLDKRANVTEAAMIAVRTGRIIFNMTDINQMSETASTRNPGVLQEVVGTERPEHYLEREPKNALSGETAWSRLDSSLQCSSDKMKLNAVGLGAFYLQLDMGNAPPLPLSQVPQGCGYSLQQNSSGLILEAPYDGCNMKQESGNYVLSLRWQETPVKLMCPILTASDATTPLLTTAMPADKPRNPSRWEANRKMHMIRPRSSRNRRYVHPNSYFYNPYMYYYYLMYAASTTTIKPATTTTTTKSPGPLIDPNHPYYHYYMAYYNYLKQFYNLTATTTSKPTNGSKGTTTSRPLPDKAQIYYNPTINNYYGQPPYPTKTTTTQSKTTTSTKTSKATITTKFTSPAADFVPFDKDPFIPVVQFRQSVNAENNQKLSPSATYRSGFSSQEDPSSVHNYWQDLLKFPQPMDQKDPSKIDWKSLINTFGHYD